MDSISNLKKYIIGVKYRFKKKLNDCDLNLGKKFDLENKLNSIIEDISKLELEAQLRIFDNFKDEKIYYSDDLLGECMTIHNLYYEFKIWFKYNYFNCKIPTMDYFTEWLKSTEMYFDSYLVKCKINLKHCDLLD